MFFIRNKNVKIEKLRFSVRNSEWDKKKQVLSGWMKCFKCYDGLRMLKYIVFMEKALDFR